MTNEEGFEYYCETMPMKAMTAADEHEKLVRDCVKAIEAMPEGYVNPEIAEKAARAVLALVAERMEKPTLAMLEAWGQVDPNGSTFDLATADWSAMLAASPLKPKKGPTQ